jgi:four helix bundle protein
VRDFKRFVVWKRAYRLALELHQVVDTFERRHRFRLGDQLVRSATSIPANITEGSGRESVREFRRYLTIAMGSATELEHHLMLARDLSVVDDQSAKGYIDETLEIQRMLHGLRDRVRY